MDEKRPTTKLLVSVRSAVEARLALDGGADLIDVKEPLRGSLGFADPHTVRAIVLQVANRVPVSVALGELLDFQGPDDELVAATKGAQFAKLGLSGCSTISGWRARWQEAMARLPRGVAPVAVAYADWRLAAAPAPHEVLSHASALGCRAILLDTFSKSRGSLKAHVSNDELRQLILAAKESLIACVLAGSLGPREVIDLLPLAPDYIAVRTAVCVGGRASQLDPARVEQLAALVHEGAASLPLG